MPAEDRAMHFSINPTQVLKIHTVVVKTAANHVDSHASFYSHYAQEIEKKVIPLKIFKPLIDNCCKSFLSTFFFIIKISFVDVSAICFFSPSPKSLKTPGSCFTAQGKKISFLQIKHFGFESHTFCLQSHRFLLGVWDFGDFVHLFHQYCIIPIFLELKAVRKRETWK